ncbi:MAG: DUF2062 domain-containing protein [Oligoflexia bacterium]|nr:DUF2062 domain-containing protein [Oligoflexia bacterium]
MENFLKSKIITPLVLQLRQGVTLKKLSLSFALGATIGIIPILGPATPLCILVGLLFKLNHVALQVGNYAVYGFQIIGIPFFLKFGDILFNKPPFSLSPSQIKSEIEILGVLDFMQKFATSILHGSFLWLMLSPIFISAFYFIAYFLIKKWGFKIEN